MWILRAVHRPHHWYLIHVDIRSQYLYRVSLFSFFHHHSSLRFLLRPIALCCFLKFLFLPKGALHLGQTISQRWTHYLAIRERLVSTLLYQIKWSFFHEKSPFIIFLKKSFFLWPRGGANLYEVYMRGIKDLLAKPWDYFYNLSETDFPLRPIDEVSCCCCCFWIFHNLTNRYLCPATAFRPKLITAAILLKLEEFLASHLSIKANFLKSHGNDHQKFVDKQVGCRKRGSGKEKRRKLKAPPFSNFFKFQIS